LGLDEISVEFYLDFFELMKEDLKKVVNESQSLGKIWPSFNKTLLAFIPKKKISSSFEEFCPISCYNVIYKLIAKLLASRLKPVFNGFISAEQFRSLDG